MTSVGIIDLGAGNVSAIKNVYKKLNVKHEVISTVSEALGKTHLILPGVGAFDDFMFRLNKSGFTPYLKEVTEQKTHAVLGVCVGMQVLASASEEGDLDGLNLVPGTVKAFPPENVVPHMGWNSLVTLDGQPSTLFEGIDFNKGFYFLHSYYFSVKDQKHALLKSDYCGEFVCSVRSARTYGVQFHPEKSHSNGLALFKNFSRV